MRAPSAIAGLLLACAVLQPSDGLAREALGKGASGADLRTACEGRDGWSDPAPPARIVGNVYYVGTCGITSVLIASPRGHVLIDGATAEAAPFILRNIRALGFEPRDVDVLLSTHEHFDHAGGLAALKAATGARFLARADARRVLESGRADPDDPQAGVLSDFAPVVVDATVADGEVVRLGDLALTAHATPGHTTGSTTWTWRTCEAKDRCLDLVYADSLTAVSRDDYRFSEHPEVVARFRSAFDAIERLPCDVLITPHPGASNLFDRIAARAPLRDSRACAEYASGARKRLEGRLAREVGAAQAP